MPATTESGAIIYRSWSDANGLTEQAEAFTTIEELFARCLEVDNPQLVDRIVVRGHDETGNLRTLTFTFQSVTAGWE